MPSLLGLLVALAVWAVLVVTAIGLGGASDGGPGRWALLVLCAVVAACALFTALVLGTRLLEAARDDAPTASHPVTARPGRHRQ